MKRRQYQGSVYSFEALERRELLAADWVAAMGGTGSDRLWDSTTDSAGNTYIVGEFSGTANGPGTDVHQPAWSVPLLPA